MGGAAGSLTDQVRTGSSDAFLSDQTKGNGRMAQHLILFLVDDDLGDITNPEDLEDFSHDLRSATHAPMRHEEVFEIGRVDRGTVAGRALVDNIVAAIDQMQISIAEDDDDVEEPILGS
jgi:hypothetical protein